MAFPDEVSPAIPWETQGVSWFAGLWGTLRQAFTPTASAPALAHGDVRSALAFALLTWLPLAALQGIIPYTHTLAFGMRADPNAAGGFSPAPGTITLLGSPSDTVIALDVARAMSLGVFLGAVQLAAMGLAFASLTRAFGIARVATAATAWRTVLYRAFIVLLLPTLMAGGLAPSDFIVSLMAFTGLFEPTLYVLLAVVGGVWLLTTLRTSARLAQGVSSGMSFVIPFMVLAVGVLVRLLAETACQPLMPPVREEPLVTSPAISAPASPTRDDPSERDPEPPTHPPSVPPEAIL
jgi:hypothetical protein